MAGSGANPATADDFDGGVLPSGTVTFPSGVNTQTITIMLAEDTTVEADEDFTVTLTPGSQTHTPDPMAVPDDSIDIVNGSQSATIENDDSATLTILDEQVNEADGTVTLTVAVDNPVQGGFTVGYSTSDGTAMAPGDYTTTIGTVTFAGIAGEAEAFTIPIINDGVVEGDETFNVSLGPVTGTTPASVAGDIDDTDGAVVTILNDDIDITLGAATPASQVEGDVAGDATEYTFTVTRTGLDTGVTTVDWTLAGSGANPATADDFDGGVLPSGTVTFPSGVNTQTITIMLAEDTTVEADEDFTVTLTPGSQTHTPDPMAVPDDSIDIVNGSQSATIENDDSATLTILDEQVNEADGTVTLTVAVDNPVQGGFTVGYSTSDGTAMAPGDYTTTIGTVTFAGIAGEAEAFTIPIINDGVVEGDETFNVSLGPVTGTTPASVAGDIDATDGAVVTILNDDIDITLGAATPASQNEGNPGDTTSFTFTVTRSGLDTGTTSVDWAVSPATGSFVSPADFDMLGDGTPDTAFPSGTVMLPNGVNSMDITINLYEESMVEPDEDFVVTLSNTSHTEDANQVPADAINFIDNGQEATIINDDSASLTVEEVSVYEDSTTNTIQVKVTLDNAVQGGFTVDYATADITALVSNNDYIPTSGTLTFVGNAGEMQLIDVDIVGDADVELDEDFKINLSNVVRLDGTGPGSGTTGGSAGLTFIVDGDTFTQPFSITNSSTAGIFVTDFTLDLAPAGFVYDTVGTGATPFTPQAGSDVTTGLLPVTVPDGSSLLDLDFNDFDPGETFSWAIDVDPPTGNATVNGDELIGATATIDFSDGTRLVGFLMAVTGNPDAAEFTVTEVTTIPGAIDITDMGTVTILNDDIDLSIQAASVTQDEGTTFEFEVTRDGFITGSTEDTTVTYTVSGIGPNAATADDFAGGAFPTGIVTFGPNDTTMTVQIVVAEDSLAEFDENFVVTLSNAQNADPNLDTLDINNDMASGTILNNDTSELVVSDTFVQEGQSGTTNAIFRVSIDNGVLAAEDITFDYMTMDDTATSPSDYIATSGTATIPQGQSFVDIAVVVNGDQDFEGGLDEFFQLIIKDPAFDGDKGDADMSTGGPGADNDPATGVPQVEIVVDTGIGTINNDDALIEFQHASTEQNEDGTNNAGPVVNPANEIGAPTLVVRGDLTGVPASERTIELRVTNALAQRNNDFTFGQFSTGFVLITIPANDYSAVGGQTFDLTQVDINGLTSSDPGYVGPPILQILNDSLIEGPEDFKVDISGFQNTFTEGDADGDTDTNLDTTHTIVDDDTAVIKVVPVDLVEDDGATPPLSVGSQNFNVVLMTSDGMGGTATLAPGVTITASVVDLMTGTAASSDYIFGSQSVTFNSPDGDGASRTLTIEAISRSSLMKRSLLVLGRFLPAMLPRRSPQWLAT